MSYAETDDLAKRLGSAALELYDDITAEAALHLEAATAEIDAAIAVKHRLPVTAPAALPLLKALNITLAEELAWGNSGGSDIPESVKRRVENARKLLELFAEGKRLLPDSEPPETAVFITGDNPVFTGKDLAGY